MRLLTLQALVSLPLGQTSKNRIEMRRYKLVRDRETFRTAASALGAGDTDWLEGPRGGGKRGVGGRRSAEREDPEG